MYIQLQEVSKVEITARGCTYTFSGSTLCHPLGRLMLGRGHVQQGIANYPGCIAKIPWQSYACPASFSIFIWQYSCVIKWKCSSWSYVNVSSMWGTRKSLLYLLVFHSIPCCLWGNAVTCSSCMISACPEDWEIETALSNPVLHMSWDWVALWATSQASEAGCCALKYHVNRNWQWLHGYCWCGWWQTPYGWVPK